MDNIVNSIINNTQKLVDNVEKNMVVSETTELTRDNGVDSLGIVNLILDIEDDLSIALDDYLVEIRNAKSVSELIEIVNKAYSEQNK